MGDCTFLIKYCVFGKPWNDSKVWEYKFVDIWYGKQCVYFFLKNQQAYVKARDGTLFRRRFCIATIDAVLNLIAYVTLTSASAVAFS